MKLARREFQIRQIGHFLQADLDYGRRVAEGLGISPSEVSTPEVAVGA
jgi:catalase